MMKRTSNVVRMMSVKQYIMHNEGKTHRESNVTSRRAMGDGIDVIFIKCGVHIIRVEVPQVVGW